MRTFETQGLIRRRQGSGTYVVGKFEAIDAGLEVLESIDTMARRMNLEVSVSDLHIEQMEADKIVADGLCVEEGTPFIGVKRVMRAESRPVAYLVERLDPNLFLSGLYGLEVVEGGEYRELADLPPDNRALNIGDFGDPELAQSWARETGDALSVAPAGWTSA